MNYFINVGNGKKKCTWRNKEICARNSDRYLSHIANSCPQAPYEVKEEVTKKRERDKDDELVEKNRKKKFTEGDIEKMNYSISKFVVSTCIPFSICDTQSWKMMWETCCSGYNPPSAKVVSNRLVKYGSKPVFLKSIETRGVAQTAENISTQISNVIEEVGQEHISSIITDNVANMRASWQLLHNKYPDLIANGCVAHAGNLILSDAFKKPFFSCRLDECKWISKIIKASYYLNNLYSETLEKLKLGGFEHGGSLEIPTPTRWYSQFSCIETVLKNKLVFVSMKNIEELAQRMVGDDYAKFIGFIDNPLFWSELSDIVHELNPIKSFILKMEADTSTIADIYLEISKLLNIEFNNIYIHELIKKRWEFIKTPSILASAILDPSIPIVLNIEDMEIAIKYIVQYNKDPKWMDEVNRYIVFGRKDYENVKVKLQTNLFLASSWWESFGRKMYPGISQLARTLRSIPSSSAASERCWSVFDFIHTKKRNRLLNSKVNKLVFLYSNGNNDSVGICDDLL